MKVNEVAKMAAKRPESDKLDSRVRGNERLSGFVRTKASSVCT
jgi:hypothetical protein